MAVTQRDQFDVNGFSSPRDEAPPAIFEVLPDALNGIQLEPGRSQVGQGYLVFREPCGPLGLIDAVMDARIVEHDHGGAFISLANQGIEKTRDIGTFDHSGARRIDEPIVVQVQCVNNVAPTTIIELHGMGQRAW